MTQDNRDSINTKVLLAEDSEDDAFFFRICLKGTGLSYDLAHVSDGRQVIDYLRAAQSGGNGAPLMPDAIFLDLKMPVLTGFDVLKWISQQSFRVPLWVAVLSGSDRESDMRLAHELGASEYLVKPLSSGELKKHLIALDKSNHCESHRECLPIPRRTTAQ